jgi:hypothetical protein
VNKIEPEYVSLSAGASFAILFYMTFYIFSFFIAIAIALYITNQKAK